MFAPEAVAAATPLAVACCFAGAWRDWELSWRYIEPNVVEALNADVFAVSDTVVRTPGTHGRGDPSFTVERMRAVFGRRFRAGEQLSTEQMANVSGLAWAEIAGAQAELGGLSKAFPYIFKIWRCGQLVARNRVRYDAIVRLRPDLVPQLPFRLSRWGSDGLELSVGPVCTRLGARAVAVHAFTNFCANDWLAVGSGAAMTLTIDLARFWTPASRWLSPDPVLDQTQPQPLWREAAFGGATAHCPRWPPGADSPGSWPRRALGTHELLSRLWSNWRPPCHLAAIRP